MTPQTLSRPLAARVADLPETAEPGDSPLVSERVLQAAIKAMQDGQTHYTDRPGILALREKAVNRLGKRYGVELSPDEATITCGATEARFVALKLLAKPGTRILAPNAAEDIQAAVRLLDLELAAPDDTSEVSVLYLTPAEDAASLLEQAAQQGWWIIYDTSQPQGTVNQPHPAQNPALAGRTVTIGGVDDSLPGWRVGWMAGSQMANKLRAFKQSMTICTTSVSQWAALGLDDASEG
jgi:aspartate/methionine/tyrosine aminotransferase